MAGEVRQNTQFSLVQIIIAAIILGWFLVMPVNMLINEGRELKTHTTQILERAKKVDIVLENSEIHNKNMKAFTVNNSSKVCMTCHLTPTMYLLRTNMNRDQFIGYVRGTKRHITNNIMPKFEEEVITDDTLSMMYTYLRRDN